ncbi:hypothetical protein HQ535_06070 [bacterium]|nr:hypothetical protein [bacterium]
MRRIMFLTGLWVTATALAAVVAWAAVGAVGDQVADPVALPLSAAEVDALGVARSTAPTSTSPPTTAATTTSTTPPTTSTSAPLTTTTDPETTSTTASVGTTAPVATTVPVATTIPVTTTLPSTTATTTPDAEEVVAFRTSGGSVVVRWSRSGGVSLVSTTPDAGWAVEIDDGGPLHVKVEFEGPGEQEAKFKAEVSGGELIVEIE